MTRRVLLTRPAERCRELARRLEDAGFDVTIAPAIRIVTLESGVEASSAALASADRVLLTSANAVRALAAPGGPPAWCVGRVTAEAARGAGFEVEHEGSAGLSELVASVREEAKLAGLSILWPCGNLSDDRDVAPWRAAGAAVLSIPVYATGSAYEKGGAPDVSEVSDVVLASPSALLFLLDALGEETGAALRARARAVAIGPTTEAALEEAGWGDVVRAVTPDDAGLLAALTAS